MQWRTDVPDKPGWTAESIRKASNDKRAAEQDRMLGNKPVVTGEPKPQPGKLVDADEARREMIRKQVEG